MEKREINEKLMKKLFIAFFAIVGLLTTIKLAIIYYDSNFNPYALPSFCTVSEFIDCDGVAKNSHSQFFGIPLAYWGMLLYVFMLFMLVVDKLKQISFLKFLEVFKHPYAYIASLGYISFIISMILAGISVFEIHKVCVLCVFTYFINLIIAIIATEWKPVNVERESGEECTYTKYCIGIASAFKYSVKDFLDALKVDKYLIVFCVLVLVATGVLTYTSSTLIFAPQVKQQKSLKEFTDLKENPFAVKGNILGDKDATVKVHVYTDYLCPICYTSNIMDHRIAQELANVKIIHHDLPLDMECNTYLKSPFHEGSCIMARYSIAAEKQGHLWDFHSALFDKRPTKEDDILKLAKEYGLDLTRLKKDAHSKATSDKIKQEIEQSIELGINGTPTIVINGQVHAGIMPYYEYKDILLKAGARERE